MRVKRISIGSGTTVCYADDGQAVAYEDYAALSDLCREQYEALQGCYQILGTLSIEPHCSECGDLAERGRDVAGAAHSEAQPAWKLAGRHLSQWRNSFRNLD